MANEVTGGCRCGAVRYEFSGEPVLSVNCYCRDCQRTSGAALSSAIFVPKASFKLTRGRPRDYESTADSGNRVSRGFCSTCGSPLFASNSAHPDAVIITMGSLDDPSKFRPLMNFWHASAPPWAPVAAELRTYPKGLV
jgi:hypothetical protein